MQQGWIRLERSLMEHWLHEDKPYNRLAAWVDLLLMANHEAKKMPTNGSVVTIDRGQLFTSSVSLSARWGWSRGKVERFMELLENDHMIDRKRTPYGQLVNIVNYSVYQDVNSKNGQQTDSKRTPNRQATDSKRTGDGQGTDTNNNINNITSKQCNNETNNNIPPAGGKERRYFPYDELLEKTFKDFREMRKKTKHPMTERAIELMLSKLEKLSADPNEQVKILEQSILHGWTDIYELKEDQGRKQTKIESIAERWADIH